MPGPHFGQVWPRSTLFPETLYFFQRWLGFFGFDFPFAIFISSLEQPFVLVQLSDP